MRLLAHVGTVDVSLVGTDWWANASVIAAGVVAALIAACVAVVGYSRQKAVARRALRAQMYATAVQAVEDYLEGPYRIRRRDGSPEARHALTRELSDIKSSIEYHKTLLRIHGSASVADAYETFAAIARTEAGPAMTAAWRERPTKRDWDVPLGAKLFSDGRSRAARDRLIVAMRVDLSP